MAANFPGSLTQPRDDIGGAKGELGGVTSLAKNVMYERWWRKELEDFDRVAIPKMKEAVTRLGELANDENFTDHGGAWAMMKSAVMAVKSEAGKYPGNPYISTKAAEMDKSLAGGFGEMTQGLKDMQATRTAAEQEKLATAKREQLLPEQLAAAKAGRQVSELQLKKSQKQEQRITDFGQMLGDPAGWGTIIKASANYQTLHEQQRKQDAAKAWIGEEGQKVRDELGVMANEKNFIANYEMNSSDMEDFDDTMFRSAVAQLDFAPDVSSSVINDMIRTNKTKTNADDAKKPITLPVSLQPGSPALNRVLWGVPGMGAGSAADLRPPSSEINKGSIAGQVLDMYARLRLDGMNHEEAKGQVFASGAAQRAIDLRINTSNKNGIATAASIMQELDDLLEEEEGNFLTSREEERQKRVLEEGTYGGAAQRVEEIIGEMASVPELLVKVFEAGKETLLGREIDPAAQEYLKTLQAKGAKAAPGASPTETVPPRLIESK